MRKTWIIAVAAAAVALVGCQREALQMEAPLSRTLKAGFEAPTRVAFSDEGVFSWKEGDVIGVPYMKADAAARMDFTLESGAGNPQAAFTTTDDITLLATDPIGVVPATALDVANAEAPIKLPASYTWAEGQSNAVMVATGLKLDAMNTFKHVGGIVKVTYKDIPAQANGFMLAANAGICGNFALQDGVIVAGPTANHVKVFFTAGEASEMSFYVPVPTGEYKLTASLIQDGYSLPGTKKETSAPVKIERKTLLLMDALTSQTVEPVTVTITTAEELTSFLADADKLGRGSKMVLAADIDAGMITPAEAFYGDVDGQGHTITYREEIPEAGADAYSGLFGYIDGSVKNLKVAGKIQTQGIKNGGIAAECAPNAVFENCESAVDILMENYGVSTPKLAGIVAVAGDGTSFTSCKNTGNIGYVLAGKPSGRSTQLGGIVANVSNHSEILNCVNEGEVRYEALGTPRIGGMVGYLNDPVDIVLSGCVNRGHIVCDVDWSSGYNYMGGMSGYVGTNADPALPIERILFVNCENYGTVEALGVATLCCRLGGIASYVGMTDAKMTAAGLADSGQTYEFRNCKNYGEVASTGETAKKVVLGGIVGFGEKVAKIICKDCVNNAPITSPTGTSNALYLGGIVGGTCGLQSVLQNIVIGPETVITGGSKMKGNLIGGNNAKFATEMTGKIAGGKIVKGSNETVVTADNYSTLLFGNAPTGSTTGIVFDGGVIPELTVKNRQTDSLALVAIYNASDGAHWAKNQWDLTKPIDEWCSKNASGAWTNGVLVENGRVTKLFLGTKTITAAEWEIPAEVANLDQLTEFRLGSNKVKGNFPDALYALRKLVKLDLSNNAMTGEIDERMENWSELGEISMLKNTGLTGSIPKSIGKLRKLYQYNMNETGISGPIPEELAGCKAMKNFMCYKTKLVGPLPEIWDQFEDLGVFQIYGIETLECPLPVSIGNIKTTAKILSLQMYNCNFTGNIPESWANLPAAASQVRVQGNKLSGTVPDAVKAHANWSKWSPEQYIFPQQEGYGLN